MPVMRRLVCPIACLLAVGLVAHAAQDTNTLRQAQEQLRKLGYDPGAADGIAGLKTAEALRMFQRDNSLPESGRLDTLTAAALAAAPARKTRAKAAGQASGQEFGHAADGTLIAGCKLLREDPIPLPLTFERLEMTHVGPEAEAIRAAAKKENAAVFIPESVPTAPVDVDAAFAGLSATDLSLEGRTLPFKTKALQEKGFLVTWGDDQEDVTLYVKWHALGRRVMYMDSKALRESVVCRRPAKR